MTSPCVQGQLFEWIFQAEFAQAVCLLEVHTRSCAAIVIEITTTVLH